ncbi:related to Chromatin structure-remodeling complex protein RSC14 [Zygosaccharomyces bailii ISA1307]|nr:related to Chromatin structure-remodeling complex protein RSC14 [Zygosaccharomyces bailii ISA1307]
MNSRLSKKKGYYDVIAGLAAFECSQDVSLTTQELDELVKAEDDKQTQVIPNSANEETRKKKVTVHGYLGGKVDLDEASNASYDLSHTLLGGYVPKRQLESLSSIDFAHYFHKSLECESALQVYDSFMASNFRRAPALPTDPVQDNLHSGTPSPAVRKSLVCKKCGARFSGSHRMHRLRKHTCNNKR